MLARHAIIIPQVGSGVPCAACSWNSNGYEPVALPTTFLSEVAKVVSVNPSYLSSLIKKETGKNFIDIIIEARLEHAKKLLQNPCHRINEVADLSGFKDYAYFYQTFKKHVGLSPKEYRNQFL